MSGNMEAVMLDSSPNQPLSPYKQIRNPKRTHRPLISRPFQNFAPHNFHGGAFHASPPSLSSSYPQQRQPPLLPLPIPQPNNCSRNRGLSCHPISRKMNYRTRDQSLTPKKSKPSLSPKKGDPKRDLQSATRETPSQCLLSYNPSGPDPMDVSRVVPAVSAVNNGSDLEVFSGPVTFTLSPPPSSLPLPTFSLRPKLSCNAEAAGIDAGATDNLRRLLRLP